MAWTKVFDRQTAGPRVVFCTTYVPRYREEFHRQVRANLQEIGIDYVLIVSPGGREERQKRDSCQIEWAVTVPAIRLPLGSVELELQNVFSKLKRGDLVVLMQQNRSVLTLVMQALRNWLPIKIALFGHGRNYQSRTPTGLRENFKKLVISRADWWFGYTDETRRYLESCGFPAQRITVFGNSIDIRGFSEDIARLTQDDIDAVRVDLGLTENAVVGTYIGGLYEEKRLPFLIAACDLIVGILPSFTLIVAGNGPSRDWIEEASKSRPWLRLLEPVYGKRKAAIYSLSQAFLMPGLLGLAVLDCAVARLPIVTTDYPYHSPEVAYLRSSNGGVFVKDWNSLNDYADSVQRVLTDLHVRQTLKEKSAVILDEFSIEKMAARFVSGAAAALGRKQEQA